jgi:hypothetical protein
MGDIPRQAEIITRFEVLSLLTHGQPIFTANNVRADIKRVGVGVEFQIGIPLTDNDFVKSLVHRLGCECFKSA